MTIVLKGARFFDGARTAVSRSSVLVIEGERIAAVVRDGQVPEVPAGATVYDLAGKTIIPGLFNCHAHLGWDGYRGLQHQSVHDSANLHGIKVARNMRGCLEAGVTTIRDLGVHHTAIAAKEARKLGLVAGPRVFAAGRAIACTGGHTWWAVQEADGPEGVRRAVRDQIKVGADWIKIMASGEAEQEYTQDELRAAADEAHMHGRKITAHATFNKAARACLEAGFDCLEHGGDYDDQVIGLMVERGVRLVPTVSPLQLQARRGLEWGMEPEAVERRRRTLANPVRLRGVARAKKAGVKLAFGTDSGSPVVPHNEIAAEVAGLLEFGVFETPAEALQAASRDSAQLMGLEKDLGTLEAGKIADVVVIDGDPFASVDDLRKVDMVFVAGRLVVDHGAVVRGL
ncbi:MAG: amidohydrolase family protein [Armatimonadetes bacterium]|nr:amidohydrolase family protein [Armatimonadota bacterium]